MADPTPVEPAELLIGLAKIGEIQESAKVRRQLVEDLTAENARLKRSEREAYKAGYAEAIARLRDDERYRSWWSSSGTFPTGEIRRHLADYLETIGAHHG